MPRALVTGGTGFAGRFLVDELAKDGVEVHATSHGGHDIATGANRIHPVDVGDAAAVTRLVREVAPDEIYHLAGLTRLASGQVAQFYDVNLGGARNVLEAVADTVPEARVLLVGSAYAYAPSTEPIAESWALHPHNHYGASKAASEMLGRAYAAQGMHVVLARPFNHSGPGQSPDFVLPTIVEQVSRAADTGGSSVTLELGNVDSVRDISDVRDVVAGYTVALRAGTPGEAYNLGSGTGRTILEMVTLVGSCAGLDVEIQQAPERTRRDDLPYLVASIDRMRELGWGPNRALETTVTDMLAAAAAREHQPVSGRPAP